VLTDLGVEDDRVRLEWISASEGQRFADIVKDMTERIRALGPSRISAELDVDPREK
jgi:F420-non-reducing hydrogenase iron-sulfur subunit